MDATSPSPPPVKRPATWLTAARARAHARIVAVLLWVGAIGLLTLGTAYRDPLGHLKWTDFVHFYTLGHIARTGPISDLYDPEAQHRHQIGLVPESAREWYLPVYPPQTALIFAPLANLPYHVAGALWALLNLMVYAGAIWYACRPFRTALAKSSLVAIAAAAFPPFWNLVLHGQTTAVPIVAFTLAAIALSRGRTLLAGLALGLLFVKPQFGLMLVVVILTCGEWSMLAGVVMAACIQAVVVAALLGPAAILDYARVVPHLATVQSALEPKVAQLHSLAVVTRLLPGYAATFTWLLACAAVSWMTVRIWRSSVPVAVRMAALALGSLMVNPHVNSYDVTLLAAPLVSISGWVAMRGEHVPDLAARWYSAVYALFVFLLIPTARLMAVQISPLVMVVLMYTLWRTAEEAALETRALKPTFA